MIKKMDYAGISGIHNRVVRILNSEAKKISKKYGYTKAESYRTINGIVRNIAGMR